MGFRTGPDRAVVQIEHACFDGTREWLAFRCTIKEVRRETAIIWRDSKQYSEEVGLEQLTPRPDPAVWGRQHTLNNSYMMGEKHA